MRMITTKDLESLADQVNTAFDRSNKRIDDLEKKIKALQEPQPAKRAAKKT